MEILTKKLAPSLTFRPECIVEKGLRIDTIMSVTRREDGIKGQIDEDNGEW
jgi:hypothetical protein